MPSKDDFHEQHPEMNDWMQSGLIPVHSGSANTVSDRVKPSEISLVGRKPGTVRTVLSAVVQRLARSEGISAEELAERIPDDTIRRTKYPVNERVLPDGSTLFEHPDGIIEGVRGLVHR